MRVAVNLEVGQEVTRMLGGSISMTLVISEVTDQLVTCGAWAFDRATGAEIDEYLGWGPPPLHTGSYIVLTREETPNATA